MPRNLFRFVFIAFQIVPTVCLGDAIASGVNPIELTPSGSEISTNAFEMLLPLAVLSAFVVLLSRVFSSPPQQATSRRRRSSRHFIPKVEKEVLSESVVGIAYLSRSGDIERANNRFCELLGYTHAELLSLSAEKLSHPTLLRNERMLSFFPTEATSRAKKNREGDNLIDKNGNIIPVVMSFSKNRGPHKDEFLLAVFKRDKRLSTTASQLSFSPFSIQPDKKVIYRFSSLQLKTVTPDELTPPLITASPTTNTNGSPLTTIDHSILSVIKNRIVSENITLTTSLSLGSTQYSIGEHDFMQMISNLFDNALLSVRTSLTNPTLHISSQLRIDRYEISISDNGIGIPVAQLPHVFDANSKSNSSVSSLALSRLKATAERYKGGIDIETAPNQGTRVILWLPLCEDEHNITHEAA